MTRKVEVVPYNLGWPKIFQAEAAALWEVFESEAEEIHHIGSTAVPGITAKPIIDIMPAVRDLAEVDKMEKEMKMLGYQIYGEYGIEERRFFTKDISGVRTFHVHAFLKDSLHYHPHLAVRDYLIAHEEARRTYGSLKRSLAWEYPNNVNAYAEGKHAFVKELEDRAVHWYRKQRK
ncbi:GrpB family protein [Alkalicoccus daliensis]|uniref:GrpB domain, predicted nucleotidyltransferase, UPF0157 family n=1 Tax=Alkalicoccus daliensis TaxID=745820 RepID=A0A1H0HX95_9BACI|nr:GrpB family protein [Alkalicoccus daliensis]SDO23753.1 GrpB domain, predicted nucleotidyltransferase, UPF0157 family [Alkalicoccus daliensis]